MKTIKVAFVDMWQGVDMRKDIIYSMLCERYNVQISDDPDYVIYADVGFDHLRYDCVRIFIATENEVPDFNVCDYAAGFAHMAFGDRYFRYPYYLRRPQACELMKVKHLNVTEDLLEREFCSFVHSNKSAMSERDGLFDLISGYKKVDSGGKHRNNIGGEPVKDKHAFEHMHKFAIACENTIHTGYTTEKIVDSFAAQTVPIYYGDPRATEVFNRDAMIVAADYPDGDALLARIREIDEDDALYLKMLRTPALLDPDHVEKMNDGMREFLFNIFDQEYEKAFRRDRGFWAEYYLRCLRAVCSQLEHPYRYACMLLMTVPRRLSRKLYSKIRRLGGRILRKFGLRR